MPLHHSAHISQWSHKSLQALLCQCFSKLCNTDKFTHSTVRTPQTVPGKAEKDHFFVLELDLSALLLFVWHWTDLKLYVIMYRASVRTDKIRILPKLKQSLIFEGKQRGQKNFSPL